MVVSQRFMNTACGLLVFITLIAGHTELRAATVETPHLIKPYYATYETRFAGFSFTIKRSLEYNREGRCRLTHEASMLFWSFAERAVFDCHQNPIQPHHYKYENNINSKKNLSIVYDWPQHQVLTVSDGKHRELALPKHSFDKLSIQEQLRLDLMAMGARFTEKTYSMIGAKSVRTSFVKKLGEETLKTPAGTFNTIKLEQSRNADNGNKVILWLAKDHEYFILRLEEVSDGGSSRVATLKRLPEGF